MSEATDRMRRFTGVGPGTGEGLAIELKSLFQGLLIIALDEGVLTHEAARAKVEKEYEYKIRRLREIYRTADPISSFTDDGIAELVRVKLLAPTGDGQWKLPDDFVQGEHVIIPASKALGRDQTVATVVSAAERERFDVDAKARMEKTSMLARLQQGMRPVKASRVALLRESMEAFGYLPQFPVLVDPRGWILDGRHRKAAALAAGVTYTERLVRCSEEDALIIAVAANESEGWTKQERRVLREQLATIRAAKAMNGDEKRAAIKAELLANHERSNRDIAKVVGCDDKTVGMVRAVLEDTADIPQYHTVGGKPKGDGTPAQPRVPSKDSALIEILVRVGERGQATKADIFDSDPTLYTRATNSMTQGEKRGYLRVIGGRKVLARTSKVYVLTDAGVELLRGYGKPVDQWPNPADQVADEPAPLAQVRKREVSQEQIITEPPVDAEPDDEPDIAAEAPLTPLTEAPMLDVDRAINAFPAWLASFGVSVDEFDQRRAVLHRATA